VSNQLRRRIAVTGVGAWSALGPNAQDAWHAVSSGRSGVRAALLSGGDHAPPAREWPVAIVDGDVVGILEARLQRRIGTSLDPFALFALGAAHEALVQAGLVGAPALRRRTAVVFGHGLGGLATLEKAFERFYGLKTAKVHPQTVPRSMVSAPVSAIAMEFGVEGPVFAVSSACSSSGHAIIQGAQLIASGRVDAALVGGSEAIVTAASLHCWDGLQAISKTACRPFSLGRDGMILGEGAGALLLEEVDHARARGASVLAELTGTGMSSDAYHLTQPSLAGAIASMTEACEAAGVLSATGLLISAHGTGTPLNDANEAAAIHGVFGDRARGHPVIATKSAHGHLIGASTALQAVLAISALRERLAPPILNMLAPDPDCDLDLVLGDARAIECEAALINSFAFGGLNTSLVFARDAR
jgi:nodulation protein E